MLGFNQDEYLTSARDIIAARQKAEQVAENIHEQGFSNIFFASVGGSLAPMMAMQEFAKEITALPVYTEQAAELICKGNKKLTKESVVITLSKSGDTKESVAIAQWGKAQGIRVVAITKNADSPLAAAATWHIPMQHKNGVEYEYMLLYWLFFRLVALNGEFSGYDRFASQLELLPENLLQAKRQFNDRADEIARRYHTSDYMIVDWRRGDVGRGVSVLNVHSGRDAVEAHQIRQLCGVLPRHAGTAGKRGPAVSGERGREVPRARRPY